MNNLLKRKVVIKVVLLALFGLSAVLLLQASQYNRAFDNSAEELLNNARLIRDQARPEYEKDVLATLQPNPYNGTFYRLDEMLAEAVVLEEPELSAAAINSGVIFAFEFDSTDSIRLEPGLGQLDVRVLDGVLSVTHHAADYLTNTAPLGIPRDEVGSIVIRARTDHETIMTLAWSSEYDPARLWENKINIDLIGDNSFHTYEINAKNALKRGLRTGDAIRKLLLKPSDRPVGSVDIDFVRFVSKLAKYRLEARGSSYETIGGEMRRVLYVIPTQTLQFSLRVPEESPTLDFGTAVLGDGAPVSFSVTIFRDDNNTVDRIYEQSLRGSETWHDARLDLSRWSGSDVRLRLRVSGTPENVALWSNPFLSSAPKKRFNVILVVEDALRADHLSTYGYGLSTSPVKDSLMKQGGVVFLYAISQATRTRPSVPSLMTSLLPTATGVWHWGDMLSDNYLTLAEVLRSQGFVTASIIQNGNAGPYAGLHQGFGVLRDEERIGRTTEDIFGDQVIAWLRHNRTRNFFSTSTS